MDSHISQLLLANRQVAYLITDTHLKVISVGGEIGLLQKLIYPSHTKRGKRRKSAKYGHSVYLKKQILDLLPELDTHLLTLQEILSGVREDPQMVQLDRTQPLVEVAQIQPPTANLVSNTDFYFDLVFSPKLDPSGNVEGVVFLIEDTTEAHMMQLNTQQLTVGKQLLQDQLDMIAHELGAPLTVISGYVELLREVAESRLESEYLQYLNLISSKVDHLHVVLKNLFDMAYVESDNFRMVMQPVNIVNLLYNIVAELDTVVAERNQHVQIKTDGEEQLITCDRLHICQALTHLLDNASKFSPLGGAIEITVSSSSRPGYVHIAITDSGAGISIQERELIFQRFYRTKFADSASFNGSGLGLYTARRVVEIHQGEIWCDNAPHAGSVFHVMLPLGKTPVSPGNQRNQRCGNGRLQVIA